MKNLEVWIPRGKLVVVTGPSGSGKSSLAFDTIYAEGYRKYMESLSTQARQVLDQLRRPDVDFIHGLSPVLAIEQRTGNASPRTTVATVTELADYAALLWVLRGEQRCPKDGGRVVRRSLDENVDFVLREAAGCRALVLAPLMRARPSVLREELPRLRQRGFQRVRIGGVVKSLDDPSLVPNGTRELAVDLVVDRLVAEAGQRSRLADSLELAFREGKDRAAVLLENTRGVGGRLGEASLPAASGGGLSGGVAAPRGNVGGGLSGGNLAADFPEWRELGLSQSLACECCGDVFEALSARCFSFNNAKGACPECGGLGRTRRFVPELLVPDAAKSVREGAVKAWRLGGKNLIIKHNALLRQLAEQLPFDMDAPWNALPEETRRVILEGAGER
ncbi:MAG: excinuclease ABC subunit A, partial [Opitutaceae bacterium]|nr:excinuclease ABC subunit A [Opitutaceae bacterium]